MVVDDHDLFRTGLCRLLESEDGLHVVGEARDGEQAVRRAAELRPEVVVMDVNMPGISGIEATRAILAGSPEVAVLMLTVSDADDEVFDAVLAGASGYLLKDTELPEIVSAIRAAATGQSMIAPRVAGSLLNRLREHRPAKQPHRVEADLSERELDVLALLARGYENSKIADELHLAVGTVKHYVARLLEKLGVDNRTQAGY